MQLVYLGMDETCRGYIRDLRNDDRIRLGFIAQGYITKEAHDKHMKLYSDSYYICVIEDELVGFIGHVEGDIRLAVSPEHQGKGIATFMLKQFICLKHAHPLTAQIKMGNVASRRVFEKAGFKETFVIMEPPN